MRAQTLTARPTAPPPGMPSSARSPKEARAALMSVRTGKPHAPGRRPKGPHSRPRVADFGCSDSAVINKQPLAAAMEGQHLADIITQPRAHPVVAGNVYAQRQEATVRRLQQFLRPLGLLGDDEVLP